MPHKDKGASREYHAEYRRKNRESVKVAHRRWAEANRERMRGYRRQWREANKERLDAQAAKRLGEARRRSWRGGLPFDLDISDVQAPQFCPVLGLELAVGGRASNSPSLDRTDNSRGYVKGNVQVISWRANMLKRDATIDEVRQLLAYMEAHQLVS
jgi:hypothetical protein